MKKIIASLLTVTMALGAAALPAAESGLAIFDTAIKVSAEENASDFSWTMNEDGTIEIVYYIGNGGNVVVPRTIDGYKVTAIGDGTFLWNESITNVTIPDTVTSIGDDAFFCCTALKSIKIPSSVTDIGNRAFNDCTSLKTITIPKSVKNIGKSAFEGCDALTEVKLNYGLKSIGDSAFNSCDNLTSINIPSSVESFGSYIFNGTKWQKEQFSQNDVIIVNNCLIDYNRSKLTSGTVLDIESKIKSIDIESAPIGICFSVSEDNANFSSDDGALFDKEKTKLLYYPAVKSEFTIPDSVTSIEDAAFSNCSELTNITIPEQIRSIGDRVFFGCSNLETIDFPDGLIHIGHDALEETPWYKNQADGIIYAGKIAYGYKGASYRAAINIKPGTKVIGSHFSTNINSPKSLTLPSGLEIIEEGALSATSDSRDFNTITIPASVKEMSNCGLGFYIPSTETEPKYTYKCYTHSAGLKYAQENKLKYTIIDTQNQTDISGLSFNYKSEYGYLDLPDEHFTVYSAADGNTTYEMKRGDDYIVELGGMEVGRHTATVTGLGNYKGKKNLTYRVTPVDISTGKIAGLKKSYSYTGNAIKPMDDMNCYVYYELPLVSWEVPEDCYTVSYKNNVKVGTATITITGKNNCKGSFSKTFQITHAHNYTKQTVEATFESPGYTLYTCSGCGNSYMEGFTPKKTVGNIVPSNFICSESSVTINWKKANNASGYRIYRYNTSTKKWDKAATLSGGNTLTYKQTGLKSGTTYKYKVKAYAKSNGNTYWGDASPTITTTTKPAKVVMKSAYSATTKAIRINWTAVTGATGYRVYRYNPSTKKWDTLATIRDGSANTYRDSKSLKSKTSYMYKVKAYRTVGGVNYWGETSAAKTCKTK